MYDHELQLGQRVEIEINYGDAVEGVIVKLWKNCYVTVLSDDGERFCGPEYNTYLLDPEGMTVKECRALEEKIAACY